MGVLLLLLIQMAIKNHSSAIVENGKECFELNNNSNLQKELYEQFKDDKSCSVAINQYTGEVLALVSTPSYDNNDFIRGMSSEKWNALNEDENKPICKRLSKGMLFILLLTNFLNTMLKLQKWFLKEQKDLQSKEKMLLYY